MAHPLVTVIARWKCRLALRAKNVPFSKIQSVIDAVDDASVDAATQAANATLPPELVDKINAASAEGATSIDWAALWAAIVAFFESPVGQSILQILVAMLMSLLGL